MKNVFVDNAWEILNLNAYNGGVGLDTASLMFRNNLDDIDNEDDQYTYGGANVDYVELARKYDWDAIPSKEKHEMRLAFCRFYKDNEKALDALYYVEDIESKEENREDFDSLMQEFYA